MTIKEFAKLAGVSVSTVSKIMNNKDSDISDETRQHVLRLAKEHSYKPYSTLISSLPSPPLIGLLLSPARQLSSVNHGILQLLGKKNYPVLPLYSSGSSREDGERLQALIHSHASAILSANAAGLPAGIKEAAEAAGIPLLDLPELPAPDFSRLGYEAAQTLWELGHRSLGLVFCKDFFWEKFLNGYRQCLFEHNLRFDSELLFEVRGEKDLNAVAASLSSGKCSALLVYEYSLGRPLLSLLSRLGYMLPRDLSVLSLKDSRDASPAEDISCIEVPYSDYGELLAARLVSLLNKEPLPEDLPLSFSLNHRKTLSPPPDAAAAWVISVGSINIDNYMNFASLPYPGKTTISHDSVSYLGGKALNQAVGVSKLGHRAYVLGRVGSDSDADTILSHLRDFDIPSQGIKRSKRAKTGQAYIFVQEGGDSMISIMAGANALVSEADIEEQEPLFQKAAFCLLQTEIPMECVIRAASLARKHRVKTVLKPSACSSLPTALLRHTDILVPNLRELDEILSDHPQYAGSGPDEKAESFFQYGIETVIVTAGADGAYIYQKDFKTHIPAIRVPSLDNSGSGDAFISALVSYLLYGYSLVRSVEIANTAAGLSIQKQGVVPALVSREELEKVLKISREPLQRRG